MSLGDVWVIPFSATVTFVMTPPNPDAVMFEGYGEATVFPGIVIGAEFEKTPHIGIGVGVGV